MMTALLMIEKKQSDGKEGLVSKALFTLMDSKASGVKILCKKSSDNITTTQKEPEPSKKCCGPKLSHEINLLVNKCSWSSRLSSSEPVFSFLVRRSSFMQLLNIHIHLPWHLRF
jgi:hypothetical protein